MFGKARGMWGKNKTKQLLKGMNKISHSESQHKGNGLKEA